MSHKKRIGKKYLNILFIIVVFFASLNFAKAGVTDTNVYSRPASPPVFGEDHKALDPTFDSTIVRVSGPTGSNAVYEDDTMLRTKSPIQHFHNPWSMSGDHFLVWEVNSTNTVNRIVLYAINSATFTVTRVRVVASGSGVMNFNAGAHFSHTNEWIVYAADTSATPALIKKYNLHETLEQDGVPANSNITLYTEPEGIDQLTQSDDDDIFCWQTKNIPKVVKVWKKSTGTLYTYNAGTEMYSFDEAQLSRDGSIVSIKGHPESGDDTSRFMDYTLTSIFDYHNYTIDRMSGKQSTFNGRWVNESSQETVFRLVTRNIPEDLPGESPWLGGSPRYAFIHPTSLLLSIHPAFSNAGYIYGGFYYPTPPAPWITYFDEIVRIEDQDALTNGNKVLRLAHAWSNFYSSSHDEIPSYASPDGKYVIFYSNWNGQSASARHDVFIVSTDNSSGDTAAPASPSGLSVL